MKEYYICSRDAIPYLYNTKYCYLTEIERFSVGYKEGLQLIIVEQLNDNDAIYLTLRCNYIIKHKLQKLPASLETVVGEFNKLPKPWWILHSND